MTPRLKVFVTGNGFNDYVVAASSRPKALAAWGVSQDLFKEGVARETDEPDLVKAALAEPGKVIERQSASRGALAKAPSGGAKSAAPAAPSKAALKRVADLEAKLAELTAAQQDRLAEVAAERAALDRREARLTQDYEADRAALAARLKTARAALKGP
jgi:hypothetical protein